jgi:hypothetical protein
MIHCASEKAIPSDSNRWKNTLIVKNDAKQPLQNK